MLVTYTQSLATLLGRATNTIRRWRNEVKAAGYIHVRTNSRTGTTTILIRESVEPPSRCAALAAERAEQERVAVLPPDARPPNQTPTQLRRWWRSPAATGWRERVKNRLGSMIYKGARQIRRTLRQVRKRRGSGEDRGRAGHCSGPDRPTCPGDGTS